MKLLKQPTTKSMITRRMFVIETASRAVFTRNDAAASINFTAVEGGDNSSYSGSEAREVFINTSSDISGVNK